MNESLNNEKKKRGRKPKEKQTQPEEKVHKKRGRRPKLKEDNNETNNNDKKYSIFQEESNKLSIILDSCIIHLKVNNKDVSNIDNEKESAIPESYNETNNFDTINEEDETNGDNLNNNIQLYEIKCPTFDIANSNLDYLENIQSMIQPYTKDKNSNFNIIDMKSTQSRRKVTNVMDFYKNGWLEKSPYVCWNCTEMFSNFPIGIPMSISDSRKFNLYGNFCSFPCAARYLTDNETGESMHEKMSMLSMLGKQMYKDNNFKLVVGNTRLSLKKFGGNQTIEQYRYNNDTNYKSVHTYMPPLVPVLYLMEEYVNDVKKSYKRQTKPIHLDTDSFMDRFDKVRKNNAIIKDGVMKNFIGNN